MRNAILYGLPKVLLNCLQLVQNREVRIVTFTKKCEHITPSLIDLHWLPVEYRIRFKILLLVYKVKAMKIAAFVTPPPSQ